MRCAKVYKEAEHRGFHKLAQYQEGRKTRSSRDARAMGKRGRHGRECRRPSGRTPRWTRSTASPAPGVRVPSAARLSSTACC